MCKRNHKPFLISLILRPQPLAEQQARSVAGLQGALPPSNGSYSRNPAGGGLPRVSHLWQRSAVRGVAGVALRAPRFLPRAARFLGNLSAAARGNLGQGRQGHAAAPLPAPHVISRARRRQAQGRANGAASRGLRPEVPLLRETEPRMLTCSLDNRAESRAEEKTFSRYE